MFGNKIVVKKRMFIQFKHGALGQLFLKYLFNGVKPNNFFYKKVKHDEHISIGNRHPIPRTGYLQISENDANVLTSKWAFPVSISTIYACKIKTWPRGNKTFFMLN